MVDQQLKEALSWTLQIDEIKSKIHYEVGRTEPPEGFPKFMTFQKVDTHHKNL